MCRREGCGSPCAAPLLRDKELNERGVRIYLCGQTAMGRNLPRAVVTPAVEMAYSAMVAHMALDREGYVLNPF